ncbi:uncharacterized protein F5147DRAFT_647310 [Suillus discolor]|uniref:Uncharacterized protein n=1 Tax=Suillus discolor TaxID=1912936 RepID=A0A9P7FK25_9AGAM|nr:uncharacterized protein F5147DRAFT_647310 [Suillus discolor]KAG2120930.1 hypothetical protein F5147DRAFT_647310 [Suillus discolor]
MAQQRLVSQQMASTHFVQLVMDSEWDSSEHEVYLIPAVMSGSDISDDEIEYVAYPAERTLRDKSGKHRAVFDEVYPPSAKDFRETLKKEQCQRFEDQKNKENIPLSAQRATGPNVQVIPQDNIKVESGWEIKESSQIEELVEDSAPEDNKQATHNKDIIRIDGPARVRPGPGAPIQREFNPTEVKKLETEVRNNLPIKENVERRYVPAASKHTEVEKRGCKEARSMPVKAQRPHYDDRDDDQIMEDAPAVREREKKGDREKGMLQGIIRNMDAKPNVSVPTLNREEPKHIPRISKLSAKIDPKLLLEQILNSQIQLSAR